MLHQSFRFEDFTLDLARLRVDGPSGEISLRPKAFEVLRHLVENAGRVVTKDEVMQVVWPGVTVTDESLTHCISEVRRALDDKAQRMIRTAPRRGYLFDAAVTTKSTSGGPATSNAAPVRLTVADDRLARPVETAVAEPPASPKALEPPAATPRQDIRFCTASDGVRIAFTSVGSGPPLVKTANWMNHLEYDWESHIWRHVLHTLTAEYRLIRYDERGTGLSDWEVDDFSPEAFVDDLESVVEAAGLDRFPLFGVSQGCAVSIAYAARHPERVSRLVLYGGYADGPRMFGGRADAFEALVTLVRHGWGRENPAFRQIFTSKFLPDATSEQVRWFNDLQRNSVSSENAARMLRAMAAIDVTHLLRQVRVPTLVLHCRHDAAVPLKAGREMAAGIPGARFVVLEGRNHVLLESDPVFPRFTDEIQAFLKS